MKKPSKPPRDDAPTEPREWAGAALVRPDAAAWPKKDPMTFFMYAASNDSTLFVALGKKDARLLPACPKKGHWRFFKSFLETGQPRIGFDEAIAKKDIAAKGHHFVRVLVDVKETAPRRSA